MIKFKNKGFTALELLTAILVIAIGVLGAYSVVQRIFAQTIDSANRIQAAYLAKEGIEVVRNIRDTNWVERNPDWDDGLGAGNWEADYNDSSLTSCPGACTSSNLRFLRIDGSGFYSYSFGGTATKFKRKITISSVAPVSGKDGIKIEVEVSWQKRGKEHRLTIQENLYDWK
jgi:prepilin-type N-terminal cleavage/methylation domain-containing protein